MSNREHELVSIIKDILKAVADDPSLQEQSVIARFLTDDELEESGLHFAKALRSAEMAIRPRTDDTTQSSCLPHLPYVGVVYTLVIGGMGVRGGGGYRMDRPLILFMSRGAR